jgi:hydrophobic/amphiphilic exporter-1 (mainly G- bacteria), HAE1 family
MQLIESIVRNPVKVIVGVLLVALFGVIALLRMPMQLTPEVSIPTLTIETAWPGADPENVEKDIIQEQEEALKGVEGVTKMTSEAMDSLGRITLEFAVGTNMNEAILTVNSRLQQVKQYPIDADRPVIRTANLSDRPIAWFILGPRMVSAEKMEAFKQAHPELAVEVEHVQRAPNEGVAVYRLRDAVVKHPELKALLPPDKDVTRLRRWAEDVIKARFERVPGVSQSNVMGGREEEMQVIVSPEKLAQHGLTLANVRDALRAQNKDTSAGDLWEWGGKRRYIVRTFGQFTTPRDIESRVIGYRGDTPIYVHMVGRVQPGFKKPDGIVRRFGQERLAINAIRSNGANVLEVMEGLRQANRELNDGILASQGLSLMQVYDETDYIYSSIGLVKDNILVGGLLTVAVLLLFLRSGRSTLVIGMAIPTSIIGSFLVLHALGRSLNVISLAGMAFAVGMLVDNAVVVLENIYRRYQMGEPRFTAAIRGTKEVWGAVLASTLTTLAVFIPVVFVQEEAGQLFRDIALAISSGIGLSLIVSITLIPVASARLLSDRPGSGQSLSTPGVNGSSGSSAGHDVSGNGHAEPQVHHIERRGLLSRLASVPSLALLSKGFRAVVLRPVDALGRGFLNGVIGLNVYLQRSVLLRLAVVVGFTAASVFLSILLMPRVEYLPTGNRNLVISILLPPSGYNLDKLIDIGADLEKDLRPFWDVDKGAPEDPSWGHPAIADYFFVARGRQLFMGIRSADDQRTAELIPRMRKAMSGIPGMIAIAKQSSLFEQGLTAGRTIDVEIVGPRLEKLVSVGGRVLGQVQGVLPGAQAVPQPSLDLNSPQLHVIPLKEQAAKNGMTTTDIGFTVDVLNDGAYIDDHKGSGKKIDLRLLSEGPVQTHTQDLGGRSFATPHGDVIPLHAIALIKQSNGPEQVNHRERERAITIQVTPPPQVPLEDAMERIEREIVQPIVASDPEFQGGQYRINLAGTSDKLRATWTALRWNFLLALLITYLLMAALFESWLYPFVVILSVPLGAVGGFLALWLLNLWVLQPLDVLTMLGFVILIGTVVNNPILIVEQTLIHMREEGMPMRQAVLESVRNRIRPIFMTTTTTLFGLLPLVLFPGSGSELYRGLGAVVLGGLLVSTIVTLVLVPAVFTLMMEAKQALLRLLGWDNGGTTPREEVPVKETPRAETVTVS